jgi:hypothetical protein
LAERPSAANLLGSLKVKKEDPWMVAKCLSAIALCLAASAGCAGQRPTSGAEDVASTRRSAFETATAAFHQALRTNDAEALFASVADDVLMMPPGEAAVRGKNAMRQWYAGFLSQYRTSARYHPSCPLI